MARPRVGGAGRVGGIVVGAVVVVMVLDPDPDPDLDPEQLERLYDGKYRYAFPGL
jgi:hypothetical protein